MTVPMLLARPCVSHLQPHMKTLRVLPTRSTYILKDLTKCTHVYIRCYSVKIPLHPANLGPFCLIPRDNKYVAIDRSRHPEIASPGRLRAAILDSETRGLEIVRNHPFPCVLRPGPLKTGTGTHYGNLIPCPSPPAPISVEKLLNPLGSHSAKLNKASTPTWWMLWEGSALRHLRALDILISNPRPSWTAEQWNHATWSKHVGEKHRLYRFTVLTCCHAGIHGLCEYAVVHFSATLYTIMKKVQKTYSPVSRILSVIKLFCNEVTVIHHSAKILVALKN